VQAQPLRQEPRVRLGEDLVLDYLAVHDTPWRGQVS
jgi:hypothetical protein